MGGRDRIAQFAVLHGQGRGMQVVPAPRGQSEAGDGRDGGQGLSAKAQKADVEQVVGRKFRRRVPLDRERQVVRRHAVPVIGDADQFLAALGQHDLDTGRPGIERVFDQFLNHARRPFDHFAGGDAVGQSFGETADRHDSQRIAGGDIGFKGGTSFPALP